jgi:hypothetical protein
MRIFASSALKPMGTRKATAFPPTYLPEYPQTGYSIQAHARIPTL